ncbi:MAG: MOSC domain-containing protein [Actinomycetales bacterium]
MIVGAVQRLWRYPVKSMQGEELTTLPLDARGAVGDRVWAVYTEDGGIGSGKTTTRFRRVPGLLDLAARWSADGVPDVSVGDGTWLRADDAGLHQRLSERLGRDVRLAAEGDIPHHDDAPLHLVTTSAIAELGKRLGTELDPRRFRANLLVDTGHDAGPVDQDWLGKRLRIGDAELRVTEPMPRCVMVGMAQPGLPYDPRILKSLAADDDLAFGVMVEVITPEPLAVGAEVRLV